MRALGVDVAVNRGLHVVLLEDDRRVVHQWSKQTPDGLARLLRETTPDVVAIDSPPKFGARGPRLVERELNLRGVKIFYSPQPERRGDAFYDWMRSGFEAFAAAELAGYPLYREGSSVAGTAVEVFPHASAVALKGLLPPPECAKSDARRRAWRQSALRADGVATDTLRTLDQVDAALAALTGVMALEGCSLGAGDPADGVIVLPCRELPQRYEREAGGGRLPRHRLVVEMSAVRLEAWSDTLRVVLQHVSTGSPVPDHLLREFRAVQADIEAWSHPREGDEV